MALQFAAVFTVISLGWPYFALRGTTLPWPATAFAIGGIALSIAIITRQSWWWKIIHTVFTPLAWAVAQLSIDPVWFLLAFGAMFLIYRGAISEQIPLYLTNTSTTLALHTFISGRGRVSFIDLGAGTGSVIKPLSKAFPEHRFTGVENAPASWLLGYLRTVSQPNCHWQWGSIWRTDLTEFDVVYAYLSPTPMSALWEKIRREMRPGSLFISNSFPVEEAEPSQTIEISEGKSRLYCYCL